METYEVKLQAQEREPFLYHGSLTPDIKEFEPRVRHTPEDGIGPRVYATQSPAWAAAHSWDWSSDEGIRLSVAEGGKIVLEVPKSLSQRLEVPIYIYRLPRHSFNQAEGSGLTFSSAEKVKPVGQSEKFNSVTEALKHFGGEIIFIE